MGWLNGAGLAAKLFGLKIPRWLEVLVAAALVIGGLLWWHSHAVSKFGTERYNAGYEQAKKDIEAATKKRNAEDAQRKHATDATSNKVSQEEGNAVIQAHDRTHARAADLLLRPSPSVRGVRCAVEPAMSGAPDPGGGVDAASAALAGGLVVLTRAEWNELIRRSAGKDVDSQTLTGWQHSYSGWYQAYQGWLADRQKIEAAGVAR